MNNHFKILWFEDNATWFEAASRGVKSSVEKHYLIYDKEEPRETGEGINFDELKKVKYDLILMDYMLASDSPEGDQLIQSIRKNQILTDVLFYSADYEKMVSAFKDRVPEIDGVYLAKRDMDLFSEKVDLLISKIVQRSEDIVNLRGMVLEATTDFETQTIEFLSKLYGEASEEKKEKLNSILNEKILQHDKETITRRIADFADQKLNVTVANDGFLSMYNRLTIFAEYAKETGNNEAKDVLEYYMSKLGYFRNKLGHVKNGDVVKVAGTKYTINQDFHRMLRKNINELEEGFQTKIDLLLNDEK